MNIFSHVICAVKRTRVEIFSSRFSKEKIVSLLITRPVSASRFANSATRDDLFDLPLDQQVQIETPNVVGMSNYKRAANKAPPSVSVITATEFKNYGWLTLSDVLLSVRGFMATNNRAYEFISARGFGVLGDYTSRIRLLIDGLRVNDSVYQQAAAGGDFPLDTDLVDGVEIIRGPGSALYRSSAFSVLSM